MLSSHGFWRQVRDGGVSVIHKTGFTSSINSCYQWSKELHIHAQHAPLRLMPLGGSITYGSGSSDGNGYRKALYEMLISNGHSVTMLGSRKSGSMHDKSNNEGWRGFRIDQIHAKAQTSLSLLSTSPNLVLINAGSNDCIQDFEVENIGRRINDMIDCVWMAAPDATVILSTLVVNLDAQVQSRVLWANEQFKAVAQQLDDEQRRVVLVDMSSKYGPQLDDLSSDGTHPHDGGYYKMAQIWYGGIQEAFSKGFIEHGGS